MLLESCFRRLGGVECAQSMLEAQGERRHRSPGIVSGLTSGEANLVSEGTVQSQHVRSNG